MPKYVCASAYDDFYSTDDGEAMDHLSVNPGHRIVVVDEDAGTGNVKTSVLISEDKE